ncbi:MAG: PHP-associated domain-containing protein [Dehalococcoidia bacterium]|nr:PHP-associated domain-containing protein [Dehalococcoidia bacterium]
MGTIIDLHIHTIVGSMDSDISPKRLGEAAKAAGLTGVALTEHMSQWQDDEVERFRQESGLFVFNAREWSTDMGHIIVLGLDRSIRGLARVRDLRAACEENGAYMILCHPFRYFPGPSNFLFGGRRDAQALPPETLAEHPLFHLTDAIEVLNGGCIERENALAQEVAQVLGRPGVAGSDAHMPSEVGRYATVFERELQSEDEMLAELRAGRFLPARRVQPGVFEPLEQKVRQ